MALGGLGVESEEHGLQIAPLLDILFVLLLFFMVMAASQKIEQGLKLQLTTTTGATHNQDKPSVPIFLKISAEQQIYFNESPVDTPSSRTLPELKKRLSTIAKLYGVQHPVLILAEANIPYQRLIDVLNACEQIQMQNISLNL
jgi:biopolymer transport protein ExbD